MIVATISFMNEEAPGSIGSLNKSKFERRAFAQASMQHNLHNQMFRKLFQKELSNPSKYKPKPIASEGDKGAMQQEKEGTHNQPEDSWKLYALCGLLIVLVIAWASVKGNNV